MSYLTLIIGILYGLYFILLQRASSNYTICVPDAVEIFSTLLSSIKRSVVRLAKVVTQGDMLSPTVNLLDARRTVYPSDA